jgi:hypothetical protein
VLLHLEVAVVVWWIQGQGEEEWRRRKKSMRKKMKILMEMMK